MMDPLMMRALGNGRLDQIQRDADVARIMRTTGVAAKDTIGAQAIVASAANLAMQAMLRCRWRKAEQAIERLRNRGAGQEAQVLQKLLARLTREPGSPERAGAVAAPWNDADAEPHTWTADTVEWLLGQWTADEGDGTGTSLEIIRELCPRAGALGSAERDLLCLSLALYARTDRDRMLGSFVLGHLAGNDAGSAEARGDAGSPAGRAATGLCFIALGDSAGGRRTLLGVVTAPGTLRAPLVEGLLDAEMTRLSRERGDVDQTAAWAERTRQFTARYGCAIAAEAAG